MYKRQSLYLVASEPLLSKKVSAAKEFTWGIAFWGVFFLDENIVFYGYNYKLVEFSLDREKRMDISLTQNDKKEHRVWHQAKQNWIKAWTTGKRRNPNVEEELINRPKRLSSLKHYSHYEKGDQTSNKTGNLQKVMIDLHLFILITHRLISSVSSKLKSLLAKNLIATSQKFYIKNGNESLQTIASVLWGAL